MKLELTQKEFGILHFALWRLLYNIDPQIKPLPFVIEESKRLFDKFNELEIDESIIRHTVDLGTKTQIGKS